MALCASNSNCQQTSKKQIHINCDYCFTLPQLFEFHFIWTIEHFSVLRSVEEKEIRSTTFVAGGLKCSLSLKVNAVFKSHIRFDGEFFASFYYPLSLKIDFADQTYASSCVSLEGKFCIISQNGLTSYNAVMPMNNFTKSAPSYSTSFISNQINCVLWNDSLKIQCELKGISEIKTTSFNYDFNSGNQVLGNFGCLLESEKFSDVTLCVDGKELKAHKAILAAQSPVFEAMFQHNMKENVTGSIDITDIEFDVMQDMLRYMYTGKVADVSSMSGLFVAADKYGLNGLKRLCSVNLVESLSLETCVSTLLLADKHSVEELKDFTLKYMNANIKIVMRTADWKAMTTSHPHLGFEFLRALADS